MELRGLWIVDDRGHLVVSRHFRTVEHRARSMHRASSLPYAALPSDEWLLSQFHAQRCTHPTSESLYYFNDTEEIGSRAGIRGGSSSGSGDYFLAFSLHGEEQQQQQERGHKVANEGALSLSTRQPLWWPFIGLVIGGVAFVALPFVDTVPELDTQKHQIDLLHGRNSVMDIPLLQYPQITGTFCLLQDLSKVYFRAIARDQQQRQQQQQQQQKQQQKQQQQKQQQKQVGVVPSISAVQSSLIMYIGQSMPFGRPIDTALQNVFHTISVPFPQRDPSLDAAVQRRPSWRGHAYTGKQRVVAILRETINSVQYDRPNIHDRRHFGGSIIVTCDIEQFADVNLPLGNIVQGKVSDIAVHHCCSQWPEILGLRADQQQQQQQQRQHDEQQRQAKSTQSNVPSSRHENVTRGIFTFNPGPGAFTLAKYQISSTATRLPIRGYYQMREINKQCVQLLVQLKLEEGVNNEFEYCDVYIPFPNRAPIVQHQLLPTFGSVVLSRDKRAVIWQLGNKFRTQNLEASMPGKVVFEESREDNVLEASATTDLMLVGNNSLAKVNFKILNWIPSGLRVDPQRVSTTPPSKLHTVQVRAETVGSSVLWNSRSTHVRFTTI